MLSKQRIWWSSSRSSGKRQQDKWNIVNIKEQNLLLLLYMHNDILKAKTVYDADLKLQMPTLIANKYLA